MRFLLSLLLLSHLSLAHAEYGAEISNTAYAEDQKVVFEFFFDHPEKINNALYWLRALLNTLTEEPYGFAPDFMEIKVVIHGTEIVTLARANYHRYSNAVERMRYYAAMGVEFKVCSISAHQYGYSAEDLPEFVELVPSAVTELVHWQNNGYALIVPKVWEKNFTIEEIQ